MFIGSINKEFLMKWLFHRRGRIVHARNPFDLNVWTKQLAVKDYGRAP